MSKSSDWIALEKKYYVPVVRRQPVVICAEKGVGFGMPTARNTWI